MSGIASTPSCRSCQNASGSLTPPGMRQLNPMIAIGSCNRSSFECNSSNLSTRLQPSSIVGRLRSITHADSFRLRKNSGRKFLRTRREGPVNRIQFFFINEASSLSESLSSFSSPFPSPQSPTIAPREPRPIGGKIHVFAKSSLERYSTMASIVGCLNTKVAESERPVALANALASSTAINESRPSSLSGSCAATGRANPPRSGFRPLHVLLQDLPALAGRRVQPV